MAKFYLSLCCCFIVCGVAFAQDKDYDYDYWQKDYNDFGSEDWSSKDVENYERNMASKEELKLNEEVDIQASLESQNENLNYEPDNKQVSDENDDLEPKNIYADNDAEEMESLLDVEKLDVNQINEHKDFFDELLNNDPAEKTFSSGDENHRDGNQNVDVNEESRDSEELNKIFEEANEDFNDKENENNGNDADGGDENHRDGNQNVDVNEKSRDSEELNKIFEEANEDFNDKENENNGNDADGGDENHRDGNQNVDVNEKSRDSEELNKIFEEANEDFNDKENENNGNDAYAIENLIESVEVDEVDEKNKLLDKLENKTIENSRSGESYEGNKQNVGDIVDVNKQETDSQELNKIFDIANEEFNDSQNRENSPNSESAEKQYDVSEQIDQLENIVKKLQNDNDDDENALESKEYFKNVPQINDGDLENKLQNIQNNDEQIQNQDDVKQYDESNESNDDFGVVIQKESSESDEDNAGVAYGDLNDDIKRLIDTVEKLKYEDNSQSIHDDKLDEVVISNESNSNLDRIENNELDKSDVNDKSLENSNEDVKISKENTNNNKIIEFNGVENKNEVLDYEEKFGRPFREALVLQQRQQIDENFDNDVSVNIDKNIVNMLEDSNSDSFENKPDNKDVDVILEKPVNVMSAEVKDELRDGFQIESNPKNNFHYPDLLDDDNFNDSDEEIIELNDKDEESVVNILIADEDNDDSSDESPEDASKENVFNLQSSIDFSDPEAMKQLTDEQISKLTSQFIFDHANNIDANDDNLNRNVNHIELRHDAIVDVCSPNYPDPYPGNTITDWFFDGDGLGVEFNVTDLSLNGFLQDYLLVKPGAEDASGNDGLLFAYTLNRPRQYRFMDVDKIFVRFRAGQGLNIFPGFCFKLKLMGPRPLPPEPLPVPEPQVPAVRYTHTVFFGYTNAYGFQELREEFRQIVADMATVYINANNIYPGEMNTSAVTNVTSISVCNINWPDYLNCAAVTFGVPLLYPDDIIESHRLNQTDLRLMWETYRGRDPYASRIKRMGVTDFEIPDEARALALWLAIGISILALMILLTLGIWKWICSEDYTKMSHYSDTESISSGKKLDLGLYPTPYQDLPALYSDQTHVYDYKFPDVTINNERHSSAGNIEGYANRSFVHDANLFDLDSDDDITKSRMADRYDRFTTDV